MYIYSSFLTINIALKNKLVINILILLATEMDMYMKYQTGSFEYIEIAHTMEFLSKLISISNSTKKCYTKDHKISLGSIIKSKA